MLRLEVFYPCKNPWRWKETLMDNNEEVIASLCLLEVDEGQKKV